jgi:quinolinate synthase
VQVLSTGAMIAAARRTKSTKVLVATETGMLYQLRRANPAVAFEAVNERATCPYMKMTTPDKLLHTLREGVHEVTLPKSIADRARSAVERMIAIGTPSMGQ